MTQSNILRGDFDPVRHGLSFLMAEGVHCKNILIKRHSGYLRSTDKTLWLLIMIMVVVSPATVTSPGPGRLGPGPGLRRVLAGCCGGGIARLAPSCSCRRLSAAVSCGGCAQLLDSCCCCLALARGEVLEPDWRPEWERWSWSPGAACRSTSSIHSRTRSFTPAPAPATCPPPRS